MRSKVRSLNGMRAVLALCLLAGMAETACRKNVRATYPTASEREVMLFTISRANAVAAESINAFGQGVEELERGGLLSQEVAAVLIRKSAEAAILDNQVVAVLRATQGLDPQSAEHIIELYNRMLFMFSAATLDTELAGIKSEATRAKILGVANLITQVVSQTVGELQRFEVLK